MDNLKNITKDSINAGWKHKTLRLFMMISFFQSAFFMWGFYASQPYLLDLIEKPDAVWISGLVAAAIALAQILGNSLVIPSIRKFQKRTTLLLLTASASALFSLGIGLSSNFIAALICLLLLMTSFGLFMPVKQSFMHQLIPKKQRATVISFDSLIGNGGGIIGQPSLGYLSKLFSISFAYVAGSIFLLSALPFIVKIRNRKDSVDRTR